MSYVHADGGPTRDGVTFDDTLWGVYVRGMDEWFAASGRRAAENHAQALNAAMIGRVRTPHPFDPICWAVPDYWPFDATAHALALSRQAAEAGT